MRGALRLAAGALVAPFALTACALVTEKEYGDRLDLDGDGVQRPADCDDADASVHGPRTWYVDGDGDDYGGALTTASCDKPDGFTRASGDCDDANPSAHPGAPEVCDGADSDCDGSADEDNAVDASTWYQDADGDGHGDAAVPFVSCASPEGYVPTLDDCDDTDPTVNPGVREVCDGRDEDCSGVADDPYWYPDDDADGYGRADRSVISCTPLTGYAIVGSDCDDSSPDIHPGAAEVCDDGCPASGSDATGYGCDEDCNGLADDADPNVVGALPSYTDAEADGYGDPSQQHPASCELPDGSAWSDADCDDADPAIGPDATDACYDGLDANCDGWSDDDCDHDGYDQGATPTTDCDDSDRDVNPDARDACSNSVDEDCDGVLAGACVMDGAHALSDAGTTLTGASAGGGTGTDVGVADMDGDGVPDVLVGTPHMLGDGYTEGGTLTVLSPPLSAGSISAATTVVQGSDADEQLGGNFATLDFDGDGLVDIVAGSPDEENGWTYLFLGPITGLDVYACCAVSSGYAADSFGYAVSGGDVDGDGRGDLVAGTLTLNYVSIYFGSAFGLDASSNLNGESGRDDAGASVDASGDVNGDGVDDLLVGAPGASRNAGAAYLLEAVGRADLSLGDADVRYTGTTSDDAAGERVCILGDTDGDGYDDIAIGAPGSDLGGSSSGTVYVITSPHAGDVALSSADATITGVAASAPLLVLGAPGDLNGDLKADLAIGDPAASGGEGVVYTFYGPLSGRTSVSTADSTLTGDASGDAAGSSLAGGDLDGDGFSDLVVGVPGLDTEAADGGGVVVVLGG